MGFDVSRKKCGAHNRVLKLLETCPECLELARERVLVKRWGERSRDHERLGAKDEIRVAWVPVGLHPDSCKHTRSTPWGRCYDCGASPRDVALDRLHRALGCQRAD